MARNLPKLTLGWGRLASFLVDFEATKVAVSAKSFIFSDYQKILIFKFIYSLSWNQIRRINVNGSQKMFLISELRKFFEVFNCFNYFLNSESLSRSERVHKFLTFGTSSKFPVQDGTVMGVKAGLIPVVYRSFTGHIPGSKNYYKNITISKNGPSEKNDHELAHYKFNALAPI